MTQPSKLLDSVFGTLTVVGEAPLYVTPGGATKRMVEVRCQCGVNRVVAATALRSGNTKSCGQRTCSTRWDHKVAESGRNAETIVFNGYKRSAKKRGRSFLLTRDQFNDLIRQDCYYCGAPPSNRMSDRRGDGKLAYSGIDRLDSSKGYEIDNVVPACITCNRAKTDMSLEQFRNWLRQTLTHMEGKST